MRIFTRSQDATLLHELYIQSEPVGDDAMPDILKIYCDLLAPVKDTMVYSHEFEELCIKEQLQKLRSHASETERNRRAQYFQQLQEARAQTWATQADNEAFDLRTGSRQGRRPWPHRLDHGHVPRTRLEEPQRKHAHHYSACLVFEVNQLALTMNNNVSAATATASWALRRDATTEATAAKPLWPSRRDASRQSRNSIISSKSSSNSSKANAISISSGSCNSNPNNNCQQRRQTAGAATALWALNRKAALILRFIVEVLLRFGASLV